MSLCILLYQGYGDHKPKSSTAAQEVKTLDGIYTEQVRGDQPMQMVAIWVGGLLQIS